VSGRAQKGEKGEGLVVGGDSFRQNLRVMKEKSHGDEENARQGRTSSVHKSKTEWGYASGT